MSYRGGADPTCRAKGPWQPGKSAARPKAVFPPSPVHGATVPLPRQAASASVRRAVLFLSSVTVGFKSCPQLRGVVVSTPSGNP